MSSDPIPDFSMLEMLEKLIDVDPEMRNAAEAYLKLDWRKIRTTEDVAEAYAGHSACELLLGPINERYIKALEGARRTLIAYSRELETWKLVRAGLVDTWEQMRGLVKDRLPADVYAELLPMFNGVSDELMGKVRGITNEYR